MTQEGEDLAWRPREPGDQPRDRNPRTDGEELILTDAHDAPAARGWVLGTWHTELGYACEDAHPATADFEVSQHAKV